MRPPGRKLTKILVTTFCVFVVSQGVAQAQSPTEDDALAAIKRATNPTTKLTAAEDFVAHFPNSTARLKVAETVVGEILKIKNGAVALALLDRAKAVFTSEQEKEILKPAALEAYAIG